MKHSVKMSEAKRIIRNHCSHSCRHETLLWYIDQLEKRLFVRSDCVTCGLRGNGDKSCPVHEYLKDDPKNEEMLKGCPAYVNIKEKVEV